MNKIYEDLLNEISNLHDIPMGAYNIRADGEGYDRQTTKNIDIVTKTDKPGIDIIIKAGTKNESVHIPVVISKSGLDDLVYNDFYIGEDADVTIVAGCGIHNPGEGKSSHDGIHRFFVGKNAKVTYVEKHYGSGPGTGITNMSPTSVVEMEEGSFMKMDTVQIKGVDYADRKTEAIIGDNATLIVEEKIMTDRDQVAKTNFEVELNGKNSSSHVISRSVASDDSFQEFRSKMDGNNMSAGHTECDAILMGKGKVVAIPEIAANHPDSSLIHEAAIGKIAGEQLMKLQTLGLSEKEAEEEIVRGFLR